MRIRKILTTSIILLLSIFTFFGCARVDMMRIIDGNYVITDKITIEFDESKLSAKGKTIDEIKAKLDGDFELLEDCIDDWKGLFASEYPDLYEEMKLGILCGKENSINNEYTLYITFANSKMFYLFYGYFNNEEYGIEGAINDVGPFLDKIANEEYKVESLGWFLYKYSMLVSDNPINNIKEFTYNGRNICDDYSTYTGYTIEDIELNQIFTYPDDRLYGNADYTEEVGGLSFFGWELNNKDGDFQLELYHLLPRAVAWYALGLIISAVVVVALIIVYKKKHKNAVQVKITKAEVEDE